ncbi:hypothetical protein U9M48_028912 [Paspalum notatum var. saurae]|uniref:Transcription factor CBF/NF-Y/archaeal histone domain-containing protein n=1 Tax=Paspalum notatum var. saurae TaxID=547442 RepID=A0AAQ3X1I4_PASNO
MESQSPKTSAPCTLPAAAELAAVPNEALASTEPAVPNLELESSVIREQDRLMPVANVSRIMRQVLPPNAKISDDAKELIQECVSEFISFVTGEANDRCHAERRKTVTAEDIVWAMNRLGFDDYVAPLATFLQRMRESEGAGRGAAGRGSRRGSPVPAEVAVRHGAQMCPAVCRLPLPVASQASAGRAVPHPPVPVGMAPHFGGRYPMLSRQRSVLLPYYGGAAAFHAGGSHGAFYADEASSSNEDPPAGRAGPH